MTSRPSRVSRSSPSTGPRTASARAGGRSPAAPTPRCTARSCGRCASSPASARAEDTNARFKELLAAGGSGLSTAFDMPTLMGRDSDDPLAWGEVGRSGVAVDTLADVETLFAGIDLGAVTTSMTINSAAPLLLAMYVVDGREGRRPTARASAARSRTTS